MERRRGYHVCFLVDASSWGGAEQHVVYLSSGLPEGSTVSALANDAQIAQKLQARGVSTSLVESTVPAWRKAIESQAPDILHIGRSALPGSRKAIAAALMGPVPFVVVDHGVAPGLSWRGRAWQRVVAHSVDALVTVSEYSAALMRRTAGLADADIRVIHNGIPLPAPCEQVRAGRTALFAGRLTPEKNVGLLLRALSELPDWRLDVVGDGPMRSPLERLATDLGVDHNVRFHGHVSPAEVGLYMCSAQALVLPSLHENFPLVLLEAMARGTPVIAASVGGIPELLGNGTGTLLDIFAPDGGLAELVTTLHKWGADPGPATCMGRAGMAQVHAQFTVAQMAAHYDELYRDVLSAT